MAVTLRVVGIFFQTDVSFDSSIQTVKDVMDAARDASVVDDKYTFNYLATSQLLTAGSGGSSNPSVTAFYAKQPPTFTSVISGIEYSGGDYFLSESMVKNPGYSVWQYYVFDQDGNFVPRPVPTQTFAEASVLDGYKIIWRLVNILAGANDIPTVYRKALTEVPETS
ncbi:MAG: hypothetical protein AAGC81_17505 [Pseudomonadota bacterium]